MSASHGPYSEPVLSIGEWRIGEASLLDVPVERVASFIDATWKRKVVIARPDYYRYQFLSAPDCHDEDKCVLVIDGEGEVVGFMGLTPHAFVRDGLVRPGAAITTWIFDDRARGHGLGKALVRYLQARYDAIVGFGISEDAIPVYLGAGFRFLRFVPRYVRVYDLEETGRIGAVDRLGAKLSQLIDAADLDVVIRESDAGRLAELAAVFPRRNGYLWDEAHLRWRYQDHPVYRHRLIEVDSPAGPSGLVIRVGETAGVRYLHVLDMFTDAARLPWVLAAVDSIARDESVAFADAYAMPSEIAVKMWCSGWFSAVDDAWVNIPRLLHPVEPTTPPTTSMIVWSSDGCALADISTLHISMGDGDLDRPTQYYMEENGL